MVIYAILVCVHFYILLAAWQHQTAVPVLLRVYVTAAAYCEQSRVEFAAVAGLTLQARQSLAVAQLYLFAVLTSADVHRLAFHPPFGSAAHLLGYLLQSLVAVLSLVVYHYQLLTVHTAHLPVRRVSHAVVYTLHHHCHMLPRRGGQREHGLGIAVRRLQHQEAFYHALYAVQLHVIRPLALALLRWHISLRQPVALAFKVHIVIHIKRYVLIMRERERQNVVALHALLLSAALTRRYFRPGIARFVVYRYYHTPMLF